MYEEIMNRPMFQTPQMREGGGIMAGVAPIRGYEEGGLANSLAEEVRGFANFLRDPKESISPELYEALKTMTTEEAFTVAGAGTLGTAALTALIQLHPALRKMKGFKPRAKMTADDLAPPASGQRVMTPGDIGTSMGVRTSTSAPGRVARAKDAVSSATSKVTAPVKTAGRVLKTTGKVGAGAAGAAAATDLATGSDYLSTGLSAALDAALKAGRITREEYDKFMATPEISALSELFSGPTPPEAPEAPEAPSPVVVTESVGDDTETAKPKTFLDMLKGAGTQFKDFLQDPANQYAFARAAQASEGIAPRNLASDFSLGKEEYKQLEAQREKGTALEENLALLTKLKPEASVDELLDILLSKDTASELAQQVRTQTLSLFGDLRGDDLNTGVSDAELMARAQNLVFGTMTGGAPAAASQGETIDLEPVE